jgi:predicted O-methyltransferase YrrM
MKTTPSETMDFGMGPDLLSRIEAYAALHQLPIMKPEGIAFLRQIIQIGHIKTVLEIGTAIGYSAIAMAITTGVSIVTIERDPDMARQAAKTIASSGFADRIRLIFADALAIDAQSLGSFDLLFIDAAKGQNLPLFQKFESCVPAGGIIVIDNLGFHGFVEHPDTIQSRDRRQMIQKIQQFNEWLLHNERFDASIYDFGDGIGLAIKK